MNENYSDRRPSVAGGIIVSISLIILIFVIGDMIKKHNESDNKSDAYTKNIRKEPPKPEAYYLQKEKYFEIPKESWERK